MRQRIATTQIRQRPDAIAGHGETGGGRDVLKEAGEGTVLEDVITQLRAVPTMYGMKNKWMDKSNN